MPKIQVQMIFEYEADPKDYAGKTDPCDMAAIDRQAFETGAFMLSEIIEADLKEITFKGISGDRITRTD